MLWRVHRGAMLVLFLLAMAAVSAIVIYGVAAHGNIFGWAFGLGAIGLAWLVDFSHKLRLKRLDFPPD